MNPILSQIKAWRLRWDAKPRENDDDLNRGFAETFSDVRGKQVLDYLMETYFKPVEFIGAADPGKLAERNGQQLMMVDILTRVDMGMHPMLYQEAPSSEDEKEMDVRQ